MLRAIGLAVCDAEHNENEDFR